MTTRRHFPAEEKVQILRLYPLEHKPISEICEQYQLNPNVSYRWQKDMFDHGAAAFERAENGSTDRTTQKLQKENSQLKAKLASKASQNDASNANSPDSIASDGGRRPVQDSRM